MTDTTTLIRSTRLLYLAFAGIEALIGLRVLLKLIAADPNNTFARTVYRLTDVLLRPFMNLTGTPSVGPMVLDLPALIGMLVYMLAGWIAVRLAWVLFAPTSSEPSSPEAQQER